MFDFGFKINYAVPKLDFNRLIVVVSSFVVCSFLRSFVFGLLVSVLHTHFLVFVFSTWISWIVCLFTAISMWFSFRRSNCNVIHQNGRNHDNLFKSIIIHYFLFFKLENRFIGLQYHRNHHHSRQQQQPQQQQ